MAKPIEPTPELTGKDARRFIEKMIKKQNSPISRKDIELARSLEKLAKDLHI